MDSKQKKPDKYVCTLSPELLKKAKEELHEDPERREMDIQELRERAESYPGLHARTDGVFLIRFLRARKFDIDLAFDMLVKFYTIQKENPDIFKNLRPSAIRPILEDGYCGVLPDRDEQGRRIVFFQSGKWNPDKYSINELLRVTVITLTKLIEEEETQVNGIVAICDMNDVKLKQLYYMTPAFIKKLFDLMQECLPLRTKRIHYVREMAIMKYVFPLFKPFFKPKMLDRVCFHTHDFASLHKFFKPEILPEEFGGLNPPYTNTDWRNLLYNCEDDFTDFEKFGLKTLVPEYNPQEQDAMDTLPGSFTRLETR